MSEIIDYRPYMENNNKVYVRVLAAVDKLGNVEPISFVWEDGSTYEVDKVTDVRRAASLKAGGVGIRYSVRVRNRPTYMFLEDDHGVSRWFMERR